MWSLFHHKLNVDPVPRLDSRKVVGPADAQEFPVLQQKSQDAKRGQQRTVSGGGEAVREGEAKADEQGEPRGERAPSKSEDDIFMDEAFNGFPMRKEFPYRGH